MKEQIDLLTGLATYARDYVKKKGIEPVDKFINFGDGLAAYSIDNHSFFSLLYDHHTKVFIHTYNSIDTCSITLNPAATVEDLQAIYEKAFKIIFEYEQNSAEVVKKQKLTKIAELESELAKLKEL